MRSHEQAVQKQPQPGPKRRSADQTCERSRSIRFYPTTITSVKSMALIVDFFSGTSGRVQNVINYKENAEPAPKRRSIPNVSCTDNNEQLPAELNEAPAAPALPPLLERGQHPLSTNADNEPPTSQLIQAPALPPVLRKGQRPPTVRRIKLFMLFCIYLDPH